MKPEIPPFLSKLFVLTGLLTMAAPAAVIVTYAENPNAVNSTVSGTSKFTFNTGLTWNAKATDVVWPGVGTYDAIYVKPADQFSGAVDTGFPSGSPYVVQSATVGGVDHVSTTTLTLTGDFAYFGLWWSAGDGQNRLSFYNDDVLVAEFTTATLLDRIAGDAAYKGNPKNRTQNPNESYAFINFFGLEGAAWDKIVFSNTTTTTGFESDNHTIRAATWNPADGPLPGVPLAVVDGPTTTPIPAPEAGSAALILISAALLAGRRHRR